MSRHREPKAASSAEAASHLVDARRCEDIAEADGLLPFHNHAAALRQAAEAYLSVADALPISTGGELQIERPDEPNLRSRLARPNRTSIEASQQRLDLLIDTDTVDLGLDLAETIGARDSLERMLAHQMALAHRLAMRFRRRAEQLIWQDGDPAMAGEASRGANAVARLMKAYQEGAQTLGKLRSGGRQVVTVQHVSVEPGGQAVVASQIERREGGLMPGIAATTRHQPHAPIGAAGLAQARAAERCGARRKYDGQPCQAPAMANGRCRVHGGKSPGAPEGERNGRYRHGGRTKAMRAERRLAWQVVRELFGLN
jgi:hypothetical protein